MLDQRLYEYISDVENPETNYNLAIEYENIGQTASAISFFLRCADRCKENLDLAYECLIHIGICFDRQGGRTAHSYGAYKQAISILPRRPEAYYAICRLKNWHSLYEDGYHYSKIALDICDFDNLAPLRNLPNYRGKFCLIFERAISSWWWGKIDECKKTFLSLCENNWDEMNDYEKNTTKKCLKEYYNIDVSQLKEKNKKQNQIPVIGVPIVNGVSWLRRLINSIDYPVKNLLIINNNGRGEIDDELNQICDLGHPLVEKIHVCHMPSNFGVSGAWNFTIKSYLMEPYWIIVNHDIMFTPGLLEKMYFTAENSDAGMVHAKKSNGYDSGCYDLFLIKDWVVQKCGLFDENLYPAYCEDIDYLIRLKNENIKSECLNIDYLHGDKDYATTGSQTWRTDENLKPKLFSSRSINEIEYLSEKWGDIYEVQNSYISPFNNQSLDSKYTRFDLEFVRKKSLGF